MLKDIADLTGSHAKIEDFKKLAYRSINRRLKNIQNILASNLGSYLIRINKNFYKIRPVYGIV